MSFWAKSIFANRLFQAVLSAFPSGAFLFPSIKCFSTDHYWYAARKNEMDSENGVCMRTLCSGPVQMSSCPKQACAQPLSFRTTTGRLLECQAQKSGRAHLSALAYEGSSAHNSKHFGIWCSEREAASMSSRQDLEGFYNLFFCPVLRWTYLCKYISYLPAVDGEP